MNSDSVQLSVVIPVYNAEHHIEHTIHSLSGFFTKHSIIPEFVLIDDKSTDATLQVLNKLLIIYPELILNLNEENIGQDRTMLKGIKRSTNNIVFLIDDDFDYSIDSLTILLNTMLSSDSELVYGIPKQRKKSRFRRIASIWSHKIAELLGYNNASNYKLISGKLLMELKSTSDSKMFNLDKYLLSSSSKYKYVTVDNIPNNQSRYSMLKLLSKFLNFIFYQKK